MTSSELKAWLEGFCEGIGKAPTVDQWAKIQKKISQNDETQMQGATSGVSLSQLNKAYEDMKKFGRQEFAGSTS
jgi:hypothetical protein